MAQHVPDALVRVRDAAPVRAFAETELGADGDLALVLGLVGEQARCHLPRVEVDERRVEERCDQQRLRLLRSVGYRMQRGAQRERRLASAGVQVDDDARLREHAARHEVRDAVRQRPSRRAGKCAIHVDVVFGRRAPVCAVHALSLSCGIRMTRPPIGLGVEVAAEPLHGDLPLVLVAVRAAEHRDARRIGRVAHTVDHRDRHEGVAPAAVEVERGAVVVFSGPGEVDCGGIDGLGHHREG